MFGSKNPAMQKTFLERYSSQEIHSLVAAIIKVVKVKNILFSVIFISPLLFLDIQLNSFYCNSWSTWKHIYVLCCYPDLLARRTGKLTLRTEILARVSYIFSNFILQKFPCSNSLVLHKDENWYSEIHSYQIMKSEFHSSSMRVKISWSYTLYTLIPVPVLKDTEVYNKISQSMCTIQWLNRFISGILKSGSLLGNSSKFISLKN